MNKLSIITSVVLIVLVISYSIYIEGIFLRPNLKNWYDSAEISRKIRLYNHDNTFIKELNEDELVAVKRYLYYYNLYCSSHSAYPKENESIYVEFISPDSTAHIEAILSHDGGFYIPITLRSCYKVPMDDFSNYLISLINEIDSNSHTPAEATDDEP